MQKQRATIDINGTAVHFDFDLTKPSQKAMYDWVSNGQVYERETVDALKAILKPGDTFIDVGAHVGWFSMIAGALVGDNGRVAALEPNPSNMRALRGNLNLNAFKISTSSVAAGSFTGRGTMFENLDNDGGHAFWDVGKHDANILSARNPHTFDVRVCELDDVVPIVWPVHAIKIDTEGAEHEVLKGATELLKRNPQCVVIAEINRFGLAQMGSSEEALRTLMEKDLGYKCFLLQGSEPPEMPFGLTIESASVFNVMWRKP